MRITVDIDSELWTEAMKATGLSSKKATANQALMALIRCEQQNREIKELYRIWRLNENDDVK
jgi:Arc/MetJ family transcription regulator